MSDDAWSEDELASITAWTLVQAFHGIAQDFGRLFGEFRLSPVQFGVLAQLAAEPGLTQAMLARRVLIRPQSMNELISTMVERGLLVREGPGGRGRPSPVRLTDAGRELLGRASAAVRAFNEPEMLGLTASEARTLNRLLHRVVESRAARQ